MFVKRGSVLDDRINGMYSGNKIFESVQDLSCVINVEYYSFAQELEIIYNFKIGGFFKKSNVLEPDIFYMWERNPSDCDSLFVMQNLEIDSIVSYRALMSKNRGQYLKFTPSLKSYIDEVLSLIDNNDVIDKKHENDVLSWQMIVTDI